MIKELINIIYYFKRNNFKTSVNNSNNLYAIGVADVHNNNMVCSYAVNNPTNKTIKNINYICKLNCLIYLICKQNDILSIPPQNQNFKMLLNLLNLNLINNNEILQRELFKDDINNEIIKTHLINNERFLNEFNIEVNKIIM